MLGKSGSGKSTLGVDRKVKSAGELLRMHRTIQPG